MTTVTEKIGIKPPVKNRHVSFLLVTPFPFNGGERYNVNVDAVISRHSGAKTKNGVFYPLGLAYISSVLIKNGYHTRLIDTVPQNVQVEEVLDYADQADCIVIPISSTRLSDSEQFLKACSQKTRIGISNFASIFSEKLLKEDICDIVIHGEVEFTCLDIAKAFSRSEKPDLSKIPGISYREDDRVIRNEDRDPTENLDVFPFPDRTGMDHSVYTEISFFGSPTAFILTARGCPFKCTYCSTHYTYHYKAYYRSPENVVAEIEEVVNKYGIKNIYFLDDTFTLIPSRVRKICDLIIKKNLNIKWACMGRLDVITGEMIHLMKMAGCIEIRFGVESGNDDILKRVKKNLTVKQIEKGVELMKEHNMRYSLFFMLGNPGETKETVKQTIRFAKTLNPFFASFNISTPLPGSELFELHSDKFDSNDLESFTTLSSNYSLCELSPKTLRKYLIFAYITYYFRPGFAVKLFLELRQRPSETIKTFQFLFSQAISIFK